MAYFDRSFNDNFTSLISFFKHKFSLDPDENQFADIGPQPVLLSYITDRLKKRTIKDLNNIQILRREFLRFFLFKLLFGLSRNLISPIYNKVH